MVDPSKVDEEGNPVCTPETDFVEGVESAVEQIAQTDEEIAQIEVESDENVDKVENNEEE